MNRSADGLIEKPELVTRRAVNCVAHSIGLNTPDGSTTGMSNLDCVYIVSSTLLRVFSLLIFSQHNKYNK
jgi:hypothetical protein